MTIDTRQGFALCSSCEWATTTTPAKAGDAVDRSRARGELARALGAHVAEAHNGAQMAPAAEAK